MKAAVYIKTKSGKTLQIMEIPTPVPRDNEVLIKVRAASVNPLDWRLKRRRPGVDVAGEVFAVGKRVGEIKPGDTVFGTCRGAFAEYVCTCETALVLKPENLTFEQAACIPIAGLTALQALRDKGGIQPGQNVLSTEPQAVLALLQCRSRSPLARKSQGCVVLGTSRWCDH